MARHITIHQYHTTNLHRHWFPQPREKNKKNPKNIHLLLYFSLCLFPHPHPFQSNPGSQGIIPRRRSDYHRITSAAAAAVLMLFKQINPSRLISALPLPTKPSTDHPVVLTVSASSQLVSSFRQAASRQLPLFFKAPQAEQIRVPAQLKG